MRVPASLLLLLIAISPAAAAGGSERTVTIFQGRQMSVTVPDGWSFAQSRDAGTGVQTVTLDDPSGEIKLLASFFPDSTNRLGSKAAIEAEMTKSFAGMLEGAVEREMKIAFTETRDGVEGHTVFTDRQFAGRDVPKGERRLATIGVRSLPGVFILFTLLSNQSESEGYKAALDVVRLGIRPDEAPPQNDRIAIVERPDVYELTVPVSRLVMSIPREGLSQKTGGQQGDGSRRYFYFEDPSRHLILSGWFEPQEEFLGVAKLWEADTGAWSRNKLPAPDKVAFKKIGSWETVSYQMPRASGSNRHLRAHWLAAGTWIDLHLSIDSESTANENAERLEALLARIKVSEK